MCLLAGKSSYQQRGYTCGRAGDVGTLPVCEVPFDHGQGFAAAAKSDLTGTGLAGGFYSCILLLICTAVHLLHARHLLRTSH